jgi:HPt (histidine-containing phosphotransfer) domain-containing protein
VAVVSGAIDQTTIAELQEAQDGLLDVLIDIFASEGPEHLDDVRQALHRADLSEAARAIHTLKGGAGTIGAKELADVCREVEKIAKAGDHEAVMELLPTLDRELSRAVTALQALRTSQAA